MRALAGVLVVAAVLAGAVAAGLGVYASGYGVPGEYRVWYRLDSFGLLLGVGKTRQAPVVYEWVVSTLLKPGPTRVEVEVDGVREACPGGVVVRVEAAGQVLEARGEVLEGVVVRESVFLVAKVRLEFDPECVAAAATEPRVTVRFEAAG